MEENTMKIKKEAQDTCFVIMPISDPDGYNTGHFLKVYKYIFKPAIEKAGFKAHRIDLEKSSNLIQERIIKQLIEAPMVLCDLSSRNPNVLFELGMRQAFDKPVVLVKDNQTERIFDISGLSTTDYRSGCIVDEVEADVEAIAQAIKETKEDSHFNSLIKLVSINSATVENKTDNKEKPNDDYNAYMLNKIYSMIDKMQDSANANNTQNTKIVEENEKNNFKQRYRRLSLRVQYLKCENNRDIIRLKLCKEEIIKLREFLYNGYTFDPETRYRYSRSLAQYEMEIDSMIDDYNSKECSKTDEDNSEADA